MCFVHDAEFAEMAARWIPQWEIVDYAHDDKVDAPSGTPRNSRPD
jgi:4-hydroxy-tetrahydrodipicolinate reductase